MPSTVIKGRESYQAFLQLPKEKDILDYIWKKLSENSGPVKSEMLQELLEMYRTSNGFDPMELSKGRLKRIKASEYKKALTEINASLEALIHGQEYKEMMKKRKNFESVFASFSSLREKLEKNTFDQGTFREINILKKDLVELEEYELLLCLYGLSLGYFESPFSEQPIPGIIEEYNQVKLMAELNNEHTITGLRTINLISEAEKGNRNNLALINLYDHLCKLLMRQSGTKAKYETLMRIIRVSSHLENKKHYMEPYLVFVQTHFQEIAKVLPAFTSELNQTLAVHLTSEALAVRHTFLNKAIEEASKDHSNYELALYKIIDAELCCDGYDYDQALKMLDEADYIILKMNVTENTSELKLKSAFTRISIYALLFLEGKRNFEPAVFEELIQIIGSSGSQRQDLKITELELHGLFQFIFGKFIEARNFFIKSAKSRENESDPVFYIIDTFFQELLRRTPDQELLRIKINQLEQLKEMFYSSLWVRILKGAIIKREIYGEVAL